MLVNIAFPHHRVFPDVFAIVVEGNPPTFIAEFEVAISL